MSLDVYLSVDGERVYERSITHNVNVMAEAAGCYMHLWRPDEIGITKASELVQSLERGLSELIAEPDKYEAMNPSNGWGSYDGLLAFVASYLSACKNYPNADVEVSR